MVKPGTSEVRDPLEVVQDYLARGVTGCLVGGDVRGEWRLYVMQGEILAAHGPDDGGVLVQRLLNGGAISHLQADKLRAELDKGTSFEGLLLGRVPEDLFLELLIQRFRQNVLDFLCGDRVPTFEPMEAVFVDNIQTGHDSHELLEGLSEMRSRVNELRLHADDLVLRAGRSRPRQQAHARLLDLVDPERLLSSLLSLSPFEEGRTLQAVLDMESAGVLELVGLGNDAPQVEAASDEPLLELEEDTQQVGVVSASGEEDLLDLASDLLEPISDFLEPIDEPVLEPDPVLEPELEPASEPELLPDPVLEPEPELVPEPPVVPQAPEVPKPEDDTVVDFGEPETEQADRHVAMAIKQAQEAEDRRAAAREELERDDDGVITRPPGFDWHEALPDDEMAFFADQDDIRGGGQGQFSTERQLLDVVDLSSEGMAAFQRAMDLPVEPPAGSPDGLIAMGEASDEEAANAVALNFSGPQLDEDDVRRKIRVVNDVLSEVVRTIDVQSGRGSGRLGLQLLVDGPPTRFGVLFRGVKVDEDGHMDAERLIRNLSKRPPAEHRRLLNEGLMDLIQRSLSTSLEELDDEHVDHMLERIAGYQQRMGL